MALDPVAGKGTVHSKQWSQIFIISHPWYKFNIAFLLIISDFSEVQNSTIRFRTLV